MPTWAESVMYHSKSEDDIFALLNLGSVQSIVEKKDGAFPPLNSDEAEICLESAITHLHCHFQTDTTVII